ncbi:peroxiredoxin [Thiomicrorhabdus chilensis]|uniref:peroxiredoxin n=1 Tax=Thiomicrorhabdus chilensis TaxID=63656 RepID=UPI0004135091|nr:peroxiredoxin [Thiomicrorhabdus chilensis]
MENQETQVISLPRLNEAAPAFDAVTTHGRKTLEDYKGKWLILFSHPADFTPVCTTEFMAFQERKPQFDAMNCELLGLSIDSHHSHIAWELNIKQNWGMEIEFPIIADLDMKVASAYGMVHPGAADTSAVRATFIIDDKGVLRAMMYYPMSNGRSMDEFVRLVKAMQASDEHGVATPAAWQPGEKVIVPPAATAEEAKARMASDDYDCVDFYFCTKSL